MNMHFPKKTLWELKYNCEATVRVKSDCSDVIVFKKVGSIDKLFFLVVSKPEGIVNDKTFIIIDLVRVKHKF